MAQGGDVFMRTCISRWVGKSSVKRAKLEEHDAMEVYGQFFKLESVVRASCDDYRAGGQEDVDEQVQDQKEGRKIDGDLLVIGSSEYLERRYDLKAVWSEWVSGKGSLEVLGFGIGCGHFIAEEAPVETANALLSFYNGHLKS
jgi:hypothetical protein